MQRQSARSGKPLPTTECEDERTLGGRISTAVLRIGSLVRAGEIVGVTDEAVARWKRGASKPPFQAVVDLCEAADLSVTWMATGEGPRHIQPEGTLSVVKAEREQMGRDLKSGAVIEADDVDAVALPRLSVEGSAGFGLVPSHEEVKDYISVSRNYLREVGISPRHAHVLRLRGHSMSPTLHDKDLVIVDTSQNRLQDEEVYAVVFGDTVLIKRLMPLWDGSVRVMSDNKGGNYPDTIIPASERRQLRIVGRVGGFLRYF